MNRLACLTLVLLLCACASPPPDYNVNRTRAYSASYDQVWEQLIGFFAARNIQVKNIAKDSGVVFAENARFDDSVADCGSPGMARVVGRRVSFNVFVNRSGSQPRVSVNTEFTETRRFMDNVTTVQCSSRGVLELSVLNSIS